MEQRAIRPGDHVMLRPGIYTEVPEFKNKTLYVRNVQGLTAACTDTTCTRKVRVADLKLIKPGGDEIVEGSTCKVVGNFSNHCFRLRSLVQVISTKKQGTGELWYLCRDGRNNEFFCLKNDLKHYRG